MHSRGDWCQATEDKTANRSLCLLHFCKQRQRDVLSRGSLLEPVLGEKPCVERNVAIVQALGELSCRMDKVRGLKTQKHGDYTNQGF